MAQTGTKRPRVHEAAASRAVEQEFGSHRFLNRELSWLESHAQFVDEAEDPAHPLAQRLRFLAFSSEKLDEFFGLRVSALRKKTQKLAQLTEGRNASGFAEATRQLAAIERRARKLVARQYHCWNHSLRPALERAGLRILRPSELGESQRAALNNFFCASLVPVLTPLAIDHCHPKPFFLDQGLYIGALLSRLKNLGPDRLFAVVQVPSELNRLVPVDEGRHSTFVFLEDVIGAHLCQLFGGHTVSDWSVFRFTRDSRVETAEEYPNCMLCSAESRLKARRRGDIVRLEVTAGANPKIIRNLHAGRSFPSRDLELENSDGVYSIPGPIDLRALVELTEMLPGGKRRQRSGNSKSARRAIRARPTDAFAKIAEGDVLLHHPYDSFSPVIEFLNQAADDPQVVSISQTLYRIRAGNPLIAPLVRAADQGKQVTALVELNARFDEADNIRWARQLEREGVHVVFGFRDLKTHCKLAIVVRQEEERIKRYVHLASGNYHHTTVPYTDFGLLTADDDIGADAVGVFHLLTGYAETAGWRKIAVAPDNLYQRTMALIKEQATRARKGAASRIFAKINSLTDKTVIEALYDASQHGVPIELVVSGVCTLRPGLAGVSENIRVRTIVDNYYEHSRLFVFGPDEAAKVFSASADWMPRNFHRRVEVMFPIDAPHLQRHILGTIVPAFLCETAKTRFLQPDGTYRRADQADNSCCFAFRSHLEHLGKS